MPMKRLRYGRSAHNDRLPRKNETGKCAGVWHAACFISGRKATKFEFEEFDMAIQKKNLSGKQITPSTTTEAKKSKPTATKLQTAVRFNTAKAHPLSAPKRPF
jgi:hypothetical protein